MLAVQRSLLIGAPPARVFEAFTDFATWRHWVPHFHELTPLSGGPLALGYQARIRERFSVVPRLWEVTALEPGRSFAWAASLLPGLRITVDHVAEPSEDATRARLALHVAGPLGLLVAPAAARLSRRTFDQSLAALKARLEGEGLVLGL